MQTDPLLVLELRSLFKAGATPSALIRVIAERHSGEPAIDYIVRLYFREAFLIPMLQIGKEVVEHIAQGGEAAVLNSRVVHRMVAARSEWDKPTALNEPTCWLDSVTATDESAILRTVESQNAAEPPAWWGSLDDEGRRFVSRTVANAQSLYERVQVLAALAEQLQQKIHAAEVAHSQTE